MGKRVNLCLDTDRGIIRIPFPDIQRVDLFTTRYSDRYKIIDSLIRILDMPISVNDIIDIYLCYENNEKTLPIKYSRDNYSSISVINEYKTYLKKNHSKINDSGIKYVFQRCFPNYENEILYDKWIEMAVEAYLKGNYGKIRETYFMIKDDVLIDINETALRERFGSSENYEKMDEDYFQYLISSINDDDKRIDALEELSMMDIEELERRLNGTSYKVVDGLRHDDVDIMYKYDKEDISQLVQLSGIYLETLKYLVNKDLGYKRK